MNKTLSTIYRSKKSSDVSFLKKEDAYVIADNLKKIIAWVGEQSKAVGEDLKFEVGFQNGERNIYGGLITEQVWLDSKAVTLWSCSYKVETNSAKEDGMEAVWRNIELAYAVLENWRQIKAEINEAIAVYMAEKEKAKFLKDFVA